MPRALPVVLVLAVLSLAFAAVPAEAILITVNFTSDFANGSFTFDSGLIPTGGGTVGALTGVTDYASSISITDTAGQSWNSGNAGVNYLTFDASGSLTGWQVGGDLSGIGVFSAGFVSDFLVGAPGPSSGGVSSPSGGTVGTTIPVWSFSPQPPYDGGTAPEPASWMLLGGALVGLAGVRRRARK